MNQKELETLKQQILKQSNRYVMIRCMLIGFSLFCLYAAIDLKYKIAWLIFISILILFLFIVKKHNQIKYKLQYYESAIEVCEEQEKRSKNQWDTLKDTGIEYLNKTDDVAYDLDLFGQRSLYQFLCNANTKMGKDKLANTLKYPSIDIREILKKQAMIQGLTKNKKTFFHFLTLSKMFCKHSSKIKEETIKETMASFQIYKNASYTFLRYLMLPTLLFIVLSFFMDFIHYVSFVISLNTIFVLIFWYKNQSNLNGIQEMEIICKDYEEMLDAIQLFEYESEILTSLKNKCVTSKKGIHELHRIAACVQTRKNIFAYFILNLLCLWDFHCVYAFEKWKETYGSSIVEWMDAIGDFEMYCSFAQIQLSMKTSCTPGLVQNDLLVLETKDAYHPLLYTPVVNSYKNDTNTNIITGSNMSGKTTFLRTLGLNMLLAKCGANVCASSWNSTIMHVYTSMRVRDDVKEGISTFYGELRRIRTMMDKAKQKEPMLILIDEIFKGTNSADRLYCARATIKKLHQTHIMTFVSTHDFELCALEQEIDAHNYHFDEHYKDDKIYFDYKIKEGPCTSTNARQLMKMAGL